MRDADERYTPKWFLDVVREYGRIVLDPCAPRHNPVDALHWYWSPAYNGLTCRWNAWVDLGGEHDVIFVNPPYSRGQLLLWAQLAVSERSDQLRPSTIMLTPNDVGTKWGTLLFEHSAAVAFPRKRLQFVRPDGAYEAGAKQPSAVWYMGVDPDRFAATFAPIANVVKLQVAA